MELIWPVFCQILFLPPRLEFLQFHLAIIFGEGRSPMTSIDAETDFKLIIIIIIIITWKLSNQIS